MHPILICLVLKHIKSQKNVLVPVASVMPPLTDGRIAPVSMLREVTPYVVSNQLSEIFYEILWKNWAMDENHLDKHLESVESSDLKIR